MTTERIDTMEQLPEGIITLKLTLSALPFQVMVTGEKTEEFRRQSEWLKSRLFRNGKLRPFTHVEFVNGYGKNKPRFTSEFKGVREVNPDSAEWNRTITYSNGLCVHINEPMYIIELNKPHNTL